MLGYAGSKAITIVATVVLAGLLSPSDFGVVALSFLAINLIGLFRDLGLGGALVLRRDLDRRGTGTVLTLMVGMGFTLALLIALLAPLVAELFAEPRMTGVVRVLALTLLFGGLNWFYETLLQRELEFRARTIASMTMSLVYASTAITLAALGAGVWSLAVGWAAGWAAQSVALLAVAPYRVSPAFDSRAARSVFRTARGFLAQGALTFAYQNVDYLAVGRILGAGPLGLYGMSYRLSELPYWALADPIAQATFPGFARMRERGEEIVSAFLDVIRFVALAICPLGALLSATAGPFTATFFDSSWAGMVPALTVLGVWGAIRPLTTTIGWMFNSVGRAELNAAVSGAGLLLLAPGVVAAASLGSIATVAWVLLAEACLALALYAFFAIRRFAVPARGLLTALGAPLLASLAAWAAARVSIEILADQPAAVALLGAGLAGLGAYALLIRLLAPDLLRSLRARIGQLMQRSRDAGEPGSWAAPRGAVADRPGVGPDGGPR